MHLLCKYTDLLVSSEEMHSGVVSPAKLTSFIRRVCNDSDFIFKTNRCATVDINTVLVSGLYDPQEDKDNFASIEVTLHYNPGQKYVDMSLLDYRRLFLEVCETLQHEHCHQSQYRKRRWKQSNKYVNDASVTVELYLNHEDEIEAYGVSIAVEVVIKNNFVVPSAVTDDIAATATYKMYQQVFGEDSIVVSTVTNYAMTYLQEFYRTTV